MTDDNGGSQNGYPDVAGCGKWAHKVSRATIESRIKLTFAPPIIQFFPLSIFHQLPPTRPGAFTAPISPPRQMRRQPSSAHMPHLAPCWPSPGQTSGTIGHLVWRREHGTYFQGHKSTSVLAQRRGIWKRKLIIEYGGSVFSDLFSSTQTVSRWLGDRPGQELVETTLMPRMTLSHRPPFEFGRGSAGDAFPTSVNIGHVSRQHDGQLDCVWHSDIHPSQIQFSS